ncbi:MAG: hypothetical protein JJU34_16575 [Lunatimonas sp.]|uniref:hypothetical protein n=1 Tax=Lunatimonas sp. TaxID=2060141 RepID=UPI00263B0671|nr:hypothetical protein [Lunatimonas sp.]MCC5938894.1 hypothetical protein [Lunatimonas sp.]
MTVLAYHTLFSVRIFHRFFLDLGASSFEQLDDRARDRQLERYDWRQFFSWMPVGNTARLLKGHQIVVKSSPTRWDALIRRDSENMQESFIPVSPDLTLVFGLYYKDPFFEHYTEMPFLSDEAMVWCNNLERFPLGDAHNPIAVEEDIFFNEGIIADASVKRSLCEQLGITLSSDCKGLLILTMQGQSGAYNILNGNGTLKQTPTDFYLNFANRATYWRYVKPEAAFSVETTDVKPLTRDGFVPIDLESDFSGSPQWPSEHPFPNPDIQFLKREGDKLISEIYL